MKSTLPKILVIVGPTASGKSDLAIQLAKKYNGEIISADSRQIYRGMDIGTAKPEIQMISGISKSKFLISKQIQNSKFKKSRYLITNPVIAGGVSHHLINIKNPDEEYTVAQYKRDCLRTIRNILKRGKLPILVGGTGLYIKAVLDNLKIPAVKPNPLLRKKLEKELKSKGVNFLYEKLIKLYPEAAYIVDRHNPRRVIRALEITLSTQKPFSAQRKQGKKLFNALKIGISLPKEKLIERINKRVDLMIRLGLINEAKSLLKKYPADLPAFDAIGYREIISHLQGELTLPQAVELIKRNTRHYAKRQMTWFKKDREIYWMKNNSQTKNFIKRLFNRLKI